MRKHSAVITDFEPLGCVPQSECFTKIGGTPPLCYPRKELLKRAQFGRERMLDVVQSWRHESPEAIVDALLHAVMLFSGRAVQVDDMTAMVIKVVEEPTG